VIDPVFPLTGLVTGMAATVLWALLLVRVLLHRHSGIERRASWVLMCGTALLASLGALASAIGSAQTIGTIDWGIDYYTLVFFTNVGRGALAMAAALLLSGAHVRKG
jgi:hypothetical protein